jgi:hypothetical protein
LSRAANTYDSASLDLTNYRGQVHVLISMGDNGAAGTLDAKFQESDDNSTFTDVTGSGASITQLAADNVKAELKRRTRSFTKRYVRVRLTVAVNACVCGATVVAVPNKHE